MNTKAVEQRQTATADPMAEKKAKWIKTARAIYWGVTIIIAALMGSAGVAYLTGASAPLEGIVHLGYPIYLLKILGVAKILGAVALLQWKFRTIKEWAYAGFTFNLLGASASHAFSGDPALKVIVPFIFLGFLLMSYKQWKTGWM